MTFSRCISLFKGTRRLAECSTAPSSGSAMNWFGQRFAAICVLLLLFSAVLISAAEADSLDPRPKGTWLWERDNIRAELHEAKDNLKLPAWFNEMLAVDYRWKDSETLHLIYDTNDINVEYRSICSEQREKCWLEEEWTIYVYSEKWKIGTAEFFITYNFKYANRPFYLERLILKADVDAFSKMANMIQQKYGHVIGGKEIVSQTLSEEELKELVKTIKFLGEIGEFVPAIAEIISTASDMYDLKVITDNSSKIYHELMAFHQEVEYVKRLLGQTIMTTNVEYDNAVFLSGGFEKQTYTMKTEIPCNEFQIGGPQERGKLALTMEQLRQVHATWKQPKAQRDFSFLPGTPISCRKPPEPDRLLPRDETLGLDSELGGIVELVEGHAENIRKAVQRCDEVTYSHLSAELEKAQITLKSIVRQRKVIFDNAVNYPPSPAIDHDDYLTTLRTPLSNAEKVRTLAEQFINSLPPFPKPCTPSEEPLPQILRAEPDANVTAVAGEKSAVIRATEPESEKCNLASIQAEIDDLYNRRSVFIDQQTQAELDVLKLNVRVNRLKLQVLENETGISSELSEVEERLADAQSYAFQITLYLKDFDARREELDKEYNLCVTGNE